MIEKTTFNANGDRLDIGVMFTKIDRENRIVSGFATLNNRDAHGDEISDQGTRNAFARFRGGIREMHQPNAVGSLIKFEEIRKYDEETDNVYNGMYVHARVSKGAEDTWQKVLDGTLKGFSIGGTAKKKFKKQDPETGDEWTVIDEYELHEISLVDNPANPLATVLTVQKIGDDFVYTDDDVMEKQVMHILIQEESGDVILSEDGERDGFTNIGWTDSPDNTEKIRQALDSYHASTEDSDHVMKSDDLAEDAGWVIKSNGDIELNETTLKATAILLEDGSKVTINGVDNTDEGGATVAKNVKKDAELETEEVEETTDEVEKSADETEEVESEDVEKSADVEDEEDEDEEVEKAADVDEVEDDSETDEDDIVSKVVSALQGEFAKATEAAKESKDAIESVQSSFDEKFADLEKSVKEELESLTKRVEDAESTTAVKKSSDVVEDDEEEDDGEDDFWRGSGFLSAKDIMSV